MLTCSRDAEKSWEPKNPQQKKIVGMNGVDHVKVWMPLYTCFGVPRCVDMKCCLWRVVNVSLRDFSLSLCLRLLTMEYQAKDMIMNNCKKFNLFDAKGGYG